jgi:hypothetical protein
MNNPYLSFQEIIDLCKQKHYTDQALGFQNPPGMVEERFRRGHSLMALRSSNAKGPKNFTLSFPISVYNKQDRIQLKFNMDYNPVEDTVRLREITAYLNPVDIEGRRKAEAEKIFLFETQRLPDLRELYEKLTAHRMAEARQVYHQLTGASVAKNILRI